MATVLEQRHKRTPAGRRNAATLRVGVDATQIVFGVSGGVEVYFKTLVRALSLDSQRLAPLLIARDDQADHLRSLFPELPIRVLPTRYPPFPIRAGRWLRRKLGPAPRCSAPPAPSVPFRTLERELDLDLVHSPVQLFADLEFQAPGVLNLHDLQHVHHPENFSPAERELRARLYTASARHAAAIVVSSRFVREDVVRALALPPHKVHVLPVACDPDLLAGLERFPASLARERYSLPKTFAFYPAALWPHKNHVRLLEALAIVRTQSPRHDLKLVCAGCRQHSGRSAVEQTLDRLGLRDHVLFLDVIPTAHLAGVYQAATFCVVPSLFEASSYPVIEAQTLGVAAMCSRVTSLPELMAEGAGLLFDPLSPEDIANTMQRWLVDPVDRHEHAERGRQRAVREHGLAPYAGRIRELYESITGRDADV